MSSFGSAPSYLSSGASEPAPAAELELGPAPPTVSVDENGEGDEATSALISNDMICVECPAERDVTPLDLLPDTPSNAEVLFVVGTQQGKVTRIGGLERLPLLKVRAINYSYHIGLFFFGA
jgi:hypothetical protein